MSKSRKVGDGIAPGPIENGVWPEKLKANVVTPGHRPRIHGYDIESDIALHYDPMSVLLLSLLGEIPSKEQVDLLRTAFMYLAPLSVAEAPGHAAVLGGLSGSEPGSILGICTICLAEQARHIREHNKEFIDWLEDPTGEPPENAKSSSEAEKESVARLQSLLDRLGVAIPAMDHDLSRNAAILSVLHRAGIVSSAHFETVFVISRLPCAIAEALAVLPGSFKEYPMRLPDFHYEENP